MPDPRRLLGRWYVALPVSLVLAALLVGLLFEERHGALQLAAQLVVVWAPLALLWLAPRLVRRWRQALLLIGSAALCLGLLWAVGPYIMQRVALPGYNHDIDHRPRRVPGRTNADGVTPDRPPLEYLAEEFNVVVLGDSFTMGTQYGLPGGARFEDTIPGQVGLLLEVPRVANFGWTPSSPVLQLRQLRQLGARYKPDLVVQLFDMSDFADDIEYADRLAMHQGYVVAPSIFDYVRAGLAVALGVDDPMRWLWRTSVFGREAVARQGERLQISKANRFFHVSQPLERSLPHMELSWATLLRTQEEAARLGARYALFVLPRHGQFKPGEARDDWERSQWPTDSRYVLEPFRFFAGKAKGAPFPVHSLLPDFKAAATAPLCWKDDPHYNLRGNRVAARAIVRHLQADGLVRALTTAPTPPGPRR